MGILSLLKEYVPFIVLGFNVAIFIVIKFNDFKHLSDDFKTLLGKVESIDKKVDSLGERVSNIEGQLR